MRLKSITGNIAKCVSAICNWCVNKQPVWLGDRAGQGHIEKGRAWGGDRGEVGQRVGTEVAIWGWARAARP